MADRSPPPPRDTTHPASSAAKSVSAILPGNSAVFPPDPAAPLNPAAPPDPAAPTQHVPPTEHTTAPGDAAFPNDAADPEVSGEATELAAEDGELGRDSDISDATSVTAWVELARANDAAAQQALWDRFFPQLVRLAEYRLSHAPHLPGTEEDLALSVLQSFFRGALKKRFPDVRGRDSLWRLLSRMTQRKVVDAIRLATRQKRVPPATSLSAAAEQADRAATPLAELIVAEEIQRLLAVLPLPMRQVAIAKLDSFTNQEIAEQLQCSLATIERRLKMIRELWSQAGQTEP